MTRSISFIVLLFCFSTLTAQHGVGPQWGEEIALPKFNNTHAQRGQLYNNMAITSSGRIIISTSEVNPANGVISGSYLTWSDNGGATWSPQQPITPLSMVIGGASPKLTADSYDNLYVLYTAKSPGALFLCRYDANLNLTLDSVRIASFVEYNSFAAHLTIDKNNRLHAIWHEGDLGQGDITECYYSRSVDNGATWSEPLPISDDDGLPSAFPRAQFDAAPGDTLAIAWRDSVGAGLKWDVQMVHSTNGGLSWSSPQTIVTSPHLDSDPDVVIDHRSSIHVFYHQYPAGDPFDGANVRYASSADLGATWSAAPFTQLSEPGARSHLVEGNRYDATHDVLWSVWKDERDFSAGVAGADMVVRYSTDGGASWNEAEFATDLGASSIGFKAAIVLPGGELAVNYEAGDPGSPFNQVYFRKRASVVSRIGNIDGAAPSVSVFPNPAQSEVYINAGSLHIANIRIWSAQGALSGYYNTPQIDIRNLPAGIYLLEINIAGEMPVLRKLVKK
ncbi:MAG: T9SS type A sorting domain-containing protein [Saprospiraceae bacterium]|jgi:hypothetical protein|nr:T9SS type A sorting domain-containing protein [Saprospiraceae bacterium]